MTEKSLLFSFAKFLELKFHCDQYVTRFHGDEDVPCTHSLHKEYIQYFCHQKMLAAFQWVCNSVIASCPVNLKFLCVHSGVDKGGGSVEPATAPLTFNLTKAPMVMVTNTSGSLNVLYIIISYHI